MRQRIVGPSLVDASRSVGFGIGMSATNYSEADAASTIGGGPAPVTAPGKPGEFDSPAAPGSSGGGVPPPVLWSVLQSFIPNTWPDGDPIRLRASAEAWQTFASAIDGIAGELTGPSGVVGGQQIPEGGAMTSAITELAQSVSGIATEAGNLATQTREFADDVKSTQDAIRDLCDRISPSGIFDGIKAVFSGEALDEIKEIADDVKEVLNNFGRQADGRISLMQKLITALDDAVVSMQQSARREFTHYLGEDVGGALATQLEIRSNISEGIIKAGLETVVGIQQLDPTRFASSPDGAGAAWSGVLDTLKYATPTGVAMDPAGALDHGKDMVGGITHAEDWRADRPGLGLGGVLFEAGSAATGVGAAKTGLRGASAAADAGEAGPAVRAAAGTAETTAPIAGRVSEITSQLDDLTTLADDVPSGAASDARGPALPPSLAEPDVPRVAEPPRGSDASGHGTENVSDPRPAELGPREYEGGAPDAGVSQQTNPTAGTSPVLDMSDQSTRGPEDVSAAEAPQSTGTLSSPSVPHLPDTETVEAGRPGNTSGDPGNLDPAGPDDLASNSNGWDESILPDETRDAIMGMDKGSRPDPSDYLPKEFIEHHLEKFGGGASRFMTVEALEDYGIGHMDGTTYVFPSRELEDLMGATGGDRRALEQALGLPEGYFDSGGVVRVDVPDPGNFGLRIPSGNEAGTNDQWIPGGFLPTGMPEAVIDGGKVPHGDLTITDLDGG
ncbi:hypothetical protein JRC04_16555 [Mycolicibacterium sp. S2-37]|uniref:WXG100-like domain-containing protein n=1 Tax=Mycolicibacterium sp. S2-37 TaxID=2810297 RepID=UPI001A94FAE8|nr:hypothetical protein [Mycolicibacterium sp. S2-37]MBO0679077.1 hypothetical protein [Mycolicibacterium sp. S2-37]